MGKATNKSTPALDVISQHGVAHQLHKYDHDSAHTSFGLEAAEKLQVDSGRVFKTLVVDTNGALAVAVVPVGKQLDLKLIAASLSAKHATMAEVAIAERTTGYIVGAISPIGQKRRLPTVIDSSAFAHETIFVSAGRRGLDVELTPQDLSALTDAHVADIAR